MTVSSLQSEETRHENEMKQHYSKYWTEVLDMKQGLEHTVSRTFSFLQLIRASVDSLLLNDLTYSLILAHVHHLLLRYIMNISD